MEGGEGQGNGAGAAAGEIANLQQGLQGLQQGLQQLANLGPNSLEGYPGLQGTLGPF